MDITCPFCNTNFYGELWDSGECPKCHERYFFDEECTEDYSDCWIVVLWEKLENL